MIPFRVLNFVGTRLLGPKITISRYDIGYDIVVDNMNGVCWEALQVIRHGLLEGDDGG